MPQKSFLQNQSGKQTRNVHRNVILMIYSMRDNTRALFLLTIITKRSFRNFSASHFLLMIITKRSFSFFLQGSLKSMGSCRKNKDNIFYTLVFIAFFYNVSSLNRVLLDNIICRIVIQSRMLKLSRYSGL